MPSPLFGNGRKRSYALNWSDTIGVTPHGRGSAIVVSELPACRGAVAPKMVMLVEEAYWAAIDFSLETFITTEHE
jgi:hypothetical protein